MPCAGQLGPACLGAGGGGVLVVTAQAITTWVGIFWFAGPAKSLFLRGFPVIAAVCA